MKNVINRVGVLVACIAVLCPLIVACSPKKEELSKELRLANYPSFYEVVNTYLSRVSSSQLSKEGGLDALHFEKNRDGWFVSNEAYEFKGKKIYTEYKNRQLIWNADSLLYSISDDTYGHQASQIEAYLDSKSMEWYDFERIPYYGYDKWDEDVIADFGDYKGANDTIVEGLARAYANYASSFLWNQYSRNKHVENDSLRRELLSGEIPSDERIKRFIENQNKAIECYKLILSRNPSYETKVGDIATKCFYEQMHTYLSLQCCNKPNEASKYLEQCVAPQHCIDQARNYFSSIPENGIVFTYGDDNTFALLYLQKKENFRTDVNVVNITLLNGIWYINYISKELDVKMLDLYNTPDFYYAYQRTKVLESPKPISIHKLLSFIYTTANEEHPWYPEMPTFIETAEGDISLSMNNAIGVGDLAALDIIQSNIKQRPIFFVYSNISPCIKSHNFIPQGLLFRLTASPTLNDEWADEQLGYLANVPPSMKASLLYSYASSTVSLYQYYKDSGNDELVVTLVEQLASVLKNNLDNIDNLSLLPVLVSPLLYEHSYFDLASALEKNMLTNLRRETFNPESLHYISRYGAVYYLQRLREQKQAFGQTCSDVDKLINEIQID